MKKILKKVFSALLLLSLLLPVLTGCHGTKGNEPFVLPQEFDRTKNYEISFWAKNDTNQTQVKIYQQTIADFEAIYPNIKVNLRLYTDYGKIYNDVITNIATNTTPNVCITYPDHIATYLTGKNVVVPLDELMVDEKFGLGGTEINFDAPTMDEIVPKFLGECTFGGNYYALPFMRSSEACYVNKTYVEALGFTLPEVLTWDFIWEVSEAATATDEEGNYLVNGQKVLIPFIYKSTDNMMITALKQKDAGYSTSEGKIEIFNDTTKEFLNEIAGHVKNGAFSTFKISGYPANFLNAGQCIFAIDSTGGATWMGSNAPLVDISEDKLVQFETAVMTVPQLDTENLQMISQGPSLCVFNKADPGEVLASWIFTQYLLSNKVQISYSQTEGYVPVTTKAQNSDEYKDYLSREGEDNDFYYDIKIKAAKLVIENTENTFVTPVFNGSASLRDAAGQLIEKVTKSVRRKEDISGDYMKDLFDNVNSLYRLDQKGNTSVGDKSDLGPLPATSQTLLWSIAAIWILIGAYFVFNLIKSEKK
ncbi:MAG: extracellular solute-binding protein [Ruminococcaceae bacterium]|nr:extracellular solute-binding protein [Oscillospiraceae bacterium]